MPVAVVPVRNVSKPPTNLIFSSKDGSIEFGYPGSPDGSDFQEVPEELFSSTRFRRAMNRGLLEQTTVDAMDEAMGAQRLDRNAIRAERDAEVAAAMASGAVGIPIVISADAMEAHIKTATTLRQDDMALADAMDEQRRAQEAAEQQFPDPMSAVNSAID